MKKDINEIMIDLKKVADKQYYVEDLFCYEECQTLYDFILNLQKHYNDNQIKYSNLQEKYKKSCETYQQALDETMSEKIDLEDKIKKAIEFIDEYCIDDEFYINLTYKEKAIIEVKEILKEDLEEKKIPEKLETWYSVLVKQSDEDNVEYANYNFSTMY